MLASLEFTLMNKNGFRNGPLVVKSLVSTFPNKRASAPLIAP
jgi:hypothetical protein